jgi:hypothetical protein
MKMSLSEAGKIVCGKEWRRPEIGTDRKRRSRGADTQGCQMVCFQSKNRNLGKFWRALLWKILVYFMDIWSILQPLEIVHGHLVYFVVIWYTFPHFGIFDQEKSGNPADTDRKCAVTWSMSK